MLRRRRARPLARVSSQRLAHCTVYYTESAKSTKAVHYNTCGGVSATPKSSFEGLNPLVILPSCFNAVGL
jgi:hypothetical protein